MRQGSEVTVPDGSEVDLLPPEGGVPVKTALRSTCETPHFMRQALFSERRLQAAGAECVQADAIFSCLRSISSNPGCAADQHGEAAAQVLVQAPRTCMTDQNS